MFVHSAHFVERHRHSPGDELSAYGQEKTGDTVRLAKMDLAIHGLSGEIREGNSYYDDLHDSVGRFDYVMANPPFNVAASTQGQACPRRSRALAVALQVTL
jgi:type I restriction enzyme M protein